GGERLPKHLHGSEGGMGKLVAVFVFASIAGCGDPIDPAEPGATPAGLAALQRPYCAFEVQHSAKAETRAGQWFIPYAGFFGFIKQGQLPADSQYAAINVTGEPTDCDSFNKQVSTTDADGKTTYRLVLAQAADYRNSAGTAGYLLQKKVRVLQDAP